MKRSAECGVRSAKKKHSPFAVRRAEGGEISSAYTHPGEFSSFALRTSHSVLSVGGFTLLELVAALAVLTIGLLGGVSVFYYGMDKLKAVDEGRAALSAARNEIEYARSLPFEQLVAAPEAPFHDPSALEGLHNARGTLAIADYPGREGRLKQVTATVVWTGENGRAIRKSLTTLVAGKEGT